MRTERESERRRRRQADLLVRSRPARKNLNILGLPKRKEWPQCHKTSSWQIRRSRLCQKNKDRAVCPKHQVVRWDKVKVSESRTLARERRIKAGVWRGKGGLHSEGRQVQGGEGEQAKRASLGEVEGSMDW